MVMDFFKKRDERVIFICSRSPIPQSIRTKLGEVTPDNWKLVILPPDLTVLKKGEVIKHLEHTIKTLKGEK